MKWYMAALGGAAKRYVDIDDAKREFLSRKKIAETEAGLKAKASLQNTESDYGGGVVFNKTDREGLLMEGDNKYTKMADDFQSSFQESFYSGDNFDNERWESWMAAGGDYDQMKRDWERIYGGATKGDQLPKLHGDAPDVFEEKIYNYDFLKNSALWDVTRGLDVHRQTESKSGVTRTADGKNVAEFFDVVEAEPQNYDENYDPKKITINSPDEAIVNQIVDTMKPVFMSDMYSGDKFKSQADYYNYMKDNEHVAIIGNALWNNINNIQGWTDDRTFEEIAEAQIYYNLDDKQILNAMNHVTQKYTIDDRGDMRTITYVNDLPSSEKTQASQGMVAHGRLMKLINDLKQAYIIAPISGLAEDVDRVLYGAFTSKSSQFNQFTASKNIDVMMEQVRHSAVSGLNDFAGFADYTITGGDGTRDTGSGGFYNKLVEVKKELQKAKSDDAHRANFMKKYLKITLAFNMALAEQGGGGGKAVSDQDFDRALERVGEGWATSVDQVLTTLDVAGKYSHFDYMNAWIGSDPITQKTAGKLREWHSKFDSAQERVITRYQTKLGGNFFFGEQYIKDPDTGRMILKEYTVRSDGTEKKLPHLGRLKFLKEFAQGGVADIDPYTAGDQGVFDMLSPHEQNLVATDDWIIESLDNIIGYSGTGAVVGDDGKGGDDIVFTPSDKYPNPYLDPQHWPDYENGYKDTLASFNAKLISTGKKAIKMAADGGININEYRIKAGGTPVQKLMRWYNTAVQRENPTLDKLNKDLLYLLQKEIPWLTQVLDRGMPHNKIDGRPTLNAKRTNQRDLDAWDEKYGDKYWPNGVEK